MLGTTGTVPGVILLVDAPDLDFKWQGAAGIANPEEESLRCPAINSSSPA